MKLEVICDGGFEISDAVKDAAPDGILCHQAEEALDQIDDRAELEGVVLVAIFAALALGLIGG